MKTSLIWATLSLPTFAFALPQNQGPCRDLAQCTQKYQLEYARLNQSGTPPRAVCNGSGCQATCTGSGCKAACTGKDLSARPWIKVRILYIA
ncbi:hypothetical protein D9756_009194 [Leucocoprinus leucothites]|uniref:Uncharacterized protein n=1 Tax=Leucocoprinus leucothites TaxID=201217 RepID=A0A8H5CZM9_9AGAR|nr:hypothetical protein D9756_009194 [Leucoagaricus leucothites]